VVVASERMDDDPGWTSLRSGELLHVDDQLRVTREIVVPDPPRAALTLADLGHVAASQT
jgi:glutamine amidotransferase